MRAGGDEPPFAEATHVIVCPVPDEARQVALLHRLMVGDEGGRLEDPLG